MDGINPSSTTNAPQSELPQNETGIRRYLPLIFLVGLVCFILGIAVGYLLVKDSRTSPARPLPADEISQLSPTPLSQKDAYVVPGWISSPSASGSPRFEDIHIAQVVTDAENMKSDVDFPAGFFNANPMSWGMVSPDKGPLTVTMKFINPVKLAAISPIFTGCFLPITENFACYTWSVRGLTANNEVEQLVKEAKGNLRKTISSSSDFSQLQITVENIEGPQGNIKPSISWEKIKLEYK